MSYPTLILWPAYLWWYGQTSDTIWPLDALALGYFVAIGAMTWMMAATFKDVLVLFRDLRNEGTTLPPTPLRLACHMLGVAACMDIGIAPMLVQIAYSALFETAQEMSHE